MRESMIGRWLVAGLLLCTGAEALSAGEKGGKPGASPASSATAPEEASQFIDRTLILVPERAGAFVLTNAHVYDDVRLGAQYRYGHPEFPGVRVDVFVYPRGRADRDAATAAGIAEVREGIAGKVEEGVYGPPVYGDEAAFDLLAVDTDGAALAADRVPPETPGPGAGRRAGRRLAVQLTMGDEVLDSRAYLFYDALYLFKGRISASPLDLPGEALDRFADRAMADIVPAIVVRNGGTCANREVAIDPDGDPDAVMQALVAAAMEGTEASDAEQCQPALDATVPDGYRGDVLVFPPGMWD